MKRENIFLSYDYANERHYKNLLLAWNANDDLSLKWSELDPAAISADGHAQLLAPISNEIDKASAFLVVIGKDTHKSEAVKWEISRAKELGKPIVAVKTDPGNITPDALYGAGATWTSFDFDSIKKAVTKK
jgi:hypothetical protein